MSQSSNDESWSTWRGAATDLRDLLRGRVREVILDPKHTWLVLDDGIRINVPVELPAIAVGGFFRDGDHEPLESAFVRSHCEPGTTMIDVGANMGWFTLMASRLVGAGGAVFAFEPNPRMYDVLARNVRENECTNVKTHHAAVGQRAGSASLFVPNGRISYGSLRRSDQEAEVFICDEVTLDETVGGDLRVSCLKIDVEGAELDVLTGARQLLERDHPALCVECVAGQLERFGASVRDLYELIRGLGYRVLEFRDGGLAELHHAGEVRPNCALLGLV